MLPGRLSNLAPMRELRPRSGAVRRVMLEREVVREALQLRQGRHAFERQRVAVAALITAAPFEAAAERAVKLVNSELGNETLSPPVRLAIMSAP